MSYWIFWAIVAALAFIAEAATVGLVSIWFGISGVVTAIIAAIFQNLFGTEPWLFPSQIAFFVILSVVFMLLLRPFAKKYIKTEHSGALGVIGKDASVVKEIVNVEGVGQIIVEGQTWSAKSSDGSVIEKGKKVKIINIKGVSAIVEEIKN